MYCMGEQTYTCSAGCGAACSLQGHFHEAGTRMRVGQIIPDLLLISNFPLVKNLGDMRHAVLRVSSGGPISALAGTRTSVSGADRRSNPQVGPEPGCGTDGGFNANVR